MSKLIKSIHQDEADIFSHNKKIEELIAKRKESITSIDITDAIFLINENKESDLRLTVRSIEYYGESYVKKPYRCAIIYTNNSFPIGLLVSYKAIEQDYRRYTGIRFISESIKSLPFSLEYVDNHNIEEIEKACKELGLKYIVAQVAEYERYEIGSDSDKTEILNTNSKFSDFCSKLNDLLRYNMKGREIEEFFEGVNLYQKIIWLEKDKKTDKKMRKAKISHYKISDCSKSKEVIDLEPVEPTLKREHVHMYSPEAWHDKIEDRKWQREIGNDWH